MKLCAKQKTSIIILVLISLDIALVLLGISLNILSLMGYLIMIIDTVVGVTCMLFIPKWRRKEKDQKLLLISDLEKMLQETHFAKIHYSNGKIIKVNHKDPDLNYLSDIEKCLKKYNAQFLLKNAREANDDLQDKAEKSIEDFHDIIGKKLKNIQLKKSMDFYKALATGTYSFPKICRTIFEEIEGKKSIFDIDKGYLWHGDTKIARGKNDSLSELESLVKTLLKDSKLNEKVNTFIEYEITLDSEELSSEFKNRLKEIINQLRWN